MYIYAAQRLNQGQWFSEPHQPVGYAWFLEGLHRIGPDTTVVAAMVQHGLGLTAAALLFGAVRRLGGPWWLGLIPAAMVALGGLQIFSEHSVLTEPLFTFLVAAGLYCAARSLDSVGVGWPVGTGIALGLAPTVRTMGLFLAVGAALWMLIHTNLSWRRRLLRTGALVLAAAVIMGGYVAGQRSETGFTGWTRTGMWNLYGRAAPFADCSKFDPPAGTRVLCERKPPSRRAGPTQYVYDVGVSPGLKHFAAPGTSAPGQHPEISRFAKAAILGQPTDYVHAVFKDLGGYLDPDSRPSVGLSIENLVVNLFDGTEPPFNQPLDYRPYYPRAGIFERSGITSALRTYERHTRLDGWVMGLAMLLALLAPLLASDARKRVGTLLFTGMAALLVLTPVATLYYDARFSIPAFGVIAGAAALGAWQLGARWQAWRARRTSVVTAG